MKNFDVTVMKPIILKEFVSRTRRSKQELDQLLDGNFNSSNLHAEESATYNRSRFPDLFTQGDLIYMTAVSPPFDYGTKLLKLHARNADGSDSVYHYNVAESQLDYGELNVTCLRGQFFDLNYNNIAAESDDLYTHCCSSMAKKVALNPFNRDVLVKVTTAAILPPEREMVYFLAKGDVAKVGVRGNLHTSIWYDEGGQRKAAIVDKKFLVATRAEGLPDYDFYEPNHSQTVSFRLISGVSEFLYVCRLEGLATTSADALDLTVGSQYGLAMLDLRHKPRHSNHHILKDPLAGAWEKEPFGGAKLSITVKFYEVGENNITHA